MLVHFVDTPMLEYEGYMVPRMFLQFLFERTEGIFPNDKPLQSILIQQILTEWLNGNVVFTLYENMIVFSRVPFYLRSIFS